MTYFSLTFSVLSFLRQMKLLWKHPESKEYQELKKINRSSGGGGGGGFPFPSHDLFALRRLVYPMILFIFFHNTNLNL